jgi:hypothetical protein
MLLILSCLECSKDLTISWIHYITSFIKNNNNIIIHDMILEHYFIYYIQIMEEIYINIGMRQKTVLITI